MKRLITVVVITALFLSSAAATYAVDPTPSGTVDIIVIIEKTISIDIGGGPIDLSRLKAGEVKVFGNPIAIKNNGSGVDETLTISVADPTGWTQGTPAFNVYRVSFLFGGDTQPAVDDTNWKTPPEISETISYDETKKLWVKFEAPTATDVVTSQSITVTITSE